jgi:hypothetical protein
MITFTPLNLQKLNIHCRTLLLYFKAIGEEMSEVTWFEIVL